MKFQLKITDDLGTHNLTEDDCCYKCSECGKEIKIRKSDIKNGIINFKKKCNCGGIMNFHYWLDGIYTEEEYRELEIQKERKYKYHSLGFINEILENMEFNK